MKIIKVLIIINYESVNLGRSFYELLINHVHPLHPLASFQFKFINCQDVDPKIAVSDLLVVFNNETLFLLKEKIAKMQPIIYVCIDDNDKNFPPNAPYLDKIIIIHSKSDSTYFFGIPRELIKIIPLDFTSEYVSLKTFHGNKVSKIRYDVGNEELLTVKKIIKIFNRKPFFQLDIFTTELNEFILKDLCNDNIKFYHNSFDKKKLAEYDLFIGSGDSAVLAIRQRIPTFILGSHGLGGLINSENLADYYRTGFKGRIGGVFGEEVPMRLLEILFKDAIEEIERYNNESLQLLDSQKVDSLFGKPNEINIQEVLRVFEEVFEKKNAMSNRTTFDSLLVKIFNQIRSTKSEKEVANIILNVDIGKILGTLNVDEHQIFSKCYQPIPIAKLHQMTPEYEKADINNFLMDLWENRIIDFIYNSPD